MYLLDPEKYRKYKSEVLKCSLANQDYNPNKNERPFTDREIAENLGLKEEEVTEIRNISELENIPFDLLKADNFKSVFVKRNKAKNSATKERKLEIEDGSDTIKEFALNEGAINVGIASVIGINEFAPEGYRPNDLLSNAKSVIVLGGNPITKSGWKSDDARLTLFSLDFQLFRKSIAFKLVRLIEKMGYTALYYDGSRKSGYTPFLSLKLCAEQAGLGTRSMAGGVILNETYGLLNYVCVITDLDLKPDGPLQNPVCPHKSCLKMWENHKKTPCLLACPECLDGEIADGKINRIKFNRNLCATRAQSTSVSAFQKMLLDIFEESNPEKRKNLILSSYFTRLIESVAYSTELVGQCFNCLANCPICKSAVKITNLQEEDFE